MGILTKVFYTYGPNLVILAWTRDELSRQQTWGRTDGLTDGRTQATTIPDGQYWPRVTIGHLFYATSSFVHHLICFITICEFKLGLVWKHPIRVKIGKFLPCVTLKFDW